ncbi:MAG TPA: PIG-L deacetylase family protein [Acidimicrobiales bacterium]|nr:PIG-L deacetylase family protein [Acidimicrobiales bacterium]
MALQWLEEEWQRGLAVVAHPDDIEYGMALAVAKWTSSGRWIGYVLATAGEAGIDAMAPAEAGPVRQEEQRRAGAAVGVSTVEFLGYPDGVIEAGLGLRRDLARAIRRHRPEVLFGLNQRLTWGGTTLNMADHRILGGAVADAARDAGNRWIFPELLDEGHQPWAGCRWIAYASSPEPTHMVDVSGHLEAGVRSLEEHRAYIEGLGTGFDARRFLSDAARGAGEAAGVELALTFEVISL